MVQEIGTAIVMFLLGSVLTYFSTRWSKTLATGFYVGYGSGISEQESRQVRIAIK